MRKTTSPKQIAANRRNAQKSTGPRTAEGREVSRMNALKHGILSKEVLVRGRVIEESEDELAALHRRFQEALQPEGPVEEMLVDQIVTARWRLRRVLAAEAGEIALSVDARECRLRQERDPAYTKPEWRWISDPVPPMMQSLAGIGLLLNWLDEARAGVAAAGGLTEAVFRKLNSRFDHRSNRFTELLEPLREVSATRPLGSAEEPPEVREARERRRDAALQVLDAESSRLQSRRGELEVEERHRAAAAQSAAILPDRDVLDKIGRYESKLERRIYRALAQLERLQRMRRGEAVPPPLTVDLRDHA